MSESSSSDPGKAKGYRILLYASVVAIVLFVGLVLVLRPRNMFVALAGVFPLLVLVRFAGQRLLEQQRRQ